jgi:hypothetical protein
MNPVKIHVTQDRLKELINYDPDTGVFTHKTQRGKTSSIGEVAGCDKPDGYRYMSVEKHRYVAHRVAWLYYYGYDAPILMMRIKADVIYPYFFIVGVFSVIAIMAISIAVYF